MYLDYLEASVLVLKKLSDEWKELSAKTPGLEPLKDALKSFQQKVNNLLYFLVKNSFLSLLK